MNIVAESFNNGTLVRLTDIDTGISTSCYQFGGKYDSAERNRAEGRLASLVESRKQQLDKISKNVFTFSEAIHEVITNGKGMCCDMYESDGPYNDIRPLPNPEIIRAMWPDTDDKMQLPFLYIESCYGKTPWTIDSSAPFARWRVVE